MSEKSLNITSSTGQIGTGGDWLDAHFETSRAQYEAQLRAVGIEPGWHVLDAACGSGSFLPWLADLVGPEGKLAALDLAPDNVALVEQRVSAWNLGCPVDATVGSVLKLPYPDDSFDALWFANTSAYLSNQELRAALAEFRRVVRPGGLIAFKEIDGTMMRLLPAPPGFFVRFNIARANSGHVQGYGAIRAPSLPRWLRQVGLINVWHRTTLIEHCWPVSSMVRAIFETALPTWAATAARLDLPSEDRDLWAQFLDGDALGRFLDEREYSSIEGNILTVGAVPGGDGPSV